VFVPGPDGLIEPHAAKIRLKVNAQTVGGGQWGELPDEVVNFLLLPLPGRRGTSELIEPGSPVGEERPPRGGPLSSISFPALRRDGCRRCGHG
jgi:hypothetical protein